MRQSSVAVALLALCLVTALPHVAVAQDPPFAAEVESGKVLDSKDARRVWGELQTLLAQHPPNLRTVLQADPSLLNRPDYLAPYPRLVEFLKQHPEVSRDPAYFLGRPDEAWSRRDESDAERRSRRAYDTLQGVLGGLAVLTGFMTTLFVVGALVRQALTQRRWARQSRIQTEVHTKILDRLQSNDELLAYIQTPAGQRFLQSGPSPVAEADPPRAMAAPFGRIFWSVQAGIILLALGIGFSLVQRNVPAEIAPAFNAMGVIVAALGLGAIVSGGVSYLLSARFGLLEKRTE
jgi:hypothetical protein